MHSLAVAGVLFALVVSSIALPLAATPAAAQQSGAPGAEANGTDIVVRQDGQCYPMRAFGNGTTSVQEFYSYRSPYTEPRGWYHAYGELQGLLRQDTSQVLLYNGSERLSLVFVHDGLANESGSGGTVAMDITGLPPGGNWTIQDDDYAGQDDVFDVGGSRAHIEWYWNEGNRSDGAAFVGLGSENWEEIRIDPAFNEQSPGHPYEKWDGPPESNELTRWIVRNPNTTESVSASAGTSASPEANTTTTVTTTANDTASVNTTDATGNAIDSAAGSSEAVETSYELDMSEPITIARGPCDEEAPTAALSASSTALTPGTEVTLNASGSTDNDAISAYRWDLDGDGTIETVTNDSTLAATYDSSGAYDPRVTVIDRANNTANASVSLQVEAETTTTTTTTTTASADTTGTGSSTADGTTETAAPTFGSGSDGDSGDADGSGASDGIDAAVERALALADRASAEVNGMERGNLIGLAVLGVALVAIGLVVLRR